MEYVIYIVHEKVWVENKHESKRLLSAFPSHSEAKTFCDHLMSNPENKHMELMISPTLLFFNIDQKPCTKINPKTHIPFDMSQMRFPIKCDLCKKNARFFCLIHSGLYCLDHVSMHD